jgi:hypothetical protein
MNLSSQGLVVLTSDVLLLAYAPLMPGGYHPCFDLGSGQ